MMGRTYSILACGDMVPDFMYEEMTSDEQELEMSKHCETCKQDYEQRNIESSDILIIGEVKSDGKIIIDMNTPGLYPGIVVLIKDSFDKETLLNLIKK